jgi:hypothetical protein
VISTYLDEDHQYLAGLIGFFGPKDVILPMIIAEVNQQVKSRRWNLFPGNLTVNIFFRKLQFLQHKLVELLIFDHQVNLSMVGTLKTHSSCPWLLIDQIQVHERDLVTSFGSFGELEDILIAIQNLDIYKGFINELYGEYNTLITVK